MLYYLITGFILFLGLIYLDSIGYLDEGVESQLLNPLKDWEEFWSRFKENLKFCFKNAYGDIFFVIFILAWPLAIIMLGWEIIYNLLINKKEEEEEEEKKDYEKE